MEGNEQRRTFSNGIFVLTGLSACALDMSHSAANLETTPFIWHGIPTRRDQERPVPRGPLWKRWARAQRS